ncbi:peptide chain release factor N(5)-glutamine methyltransferase [Paenibacillus agilis]|uniref:Release factor glutamine methyltransferase n=1 Tax=Paenibacillus agilis TaxID=3020863 RepID=A0A559IPF8_9BACL|nr:peptide chain release factor N(5)-glutamine methyltransferase [Paenibacillus agilis]TVX89515.1 peptide chain release factor N(5)-glutamine methyltransferase [Paenibacillus agilis]
MSERNLIDGPLQPFSLIPPLTIREAWVQASSYLSASGVEDAGHHAELLLRHALTWERVTYLMRMQDEFPAASHESYREMIQRRGRGEPTQYIIGEAYFYGLSFRVTPDVLIPRPETELLVEAVLEEAERLWGRTASIRAADVGTGSGAIACALASERSSWHVRAVDISAAALRVARSNAQQLGVVERLEWLEGDLLLPLEGIELDVLVSNPPYIPDEDRAGLMREVRDYEPHTALFGGEDGLEPYRRMMAMLPRLASLPRIVAFELGRGQAQDVAALVREAGYPHIRIVNDLAGIERHVLGILD